MAQKMKMGWLEKQSKHLRIFRKRWIETYFRDKLCSYSKLSDESATEMIDLSGIHKAYKSNIDTNEFVIAYFEDGNIKSRRFRASTTKEAKEWIDFFNQEVDIEHHCPSCDKLDQQIMSKLHINEYNIHTNSISNTHIDYDNNINNRLIEGASKQYIPISTTKNNGSLEDLIDEIAFDITHNHQYLKVVLECKVNEDSETNQVNMSSNS